MHDALESVIGDLASPFKAFLPDFAILESKIEEIFEDRFDLQGEYLHVPENLRKRTQMLSNYNKTKCLVKQNTVITGIFSIHLTQFKELCIITPSTKSFTWEKHSA